MIPRNDCPGGPTRQESLAAVRSAEDKLDEAAEKMKDALDDYVAGIKTHNGGEFDFPTMYRPVLVASKEMHGFATDLLDAQDEAAYYGHHSDEAEMDAAADRCEISEMYKFQHGGG